MYTHMDKLLLHDPELHRLVAAKTGFDSGIQEVEPTDFQFEGQSHGEAMQKLITFGKAQKDLPLPTGAEIQQAADAAKAKEAQEALDKSRAIQRAEDYVRDAGLADSDGNAALIRGWIEKAGGVWTAQLVDAAITALNNQLEWRSEPAPESEKPKELGTLSDGSTQLSLDVVPNKHHSKQQLKDWLNRTREATGKYLRPSGSWGSSF